MKTPIHKYTHKLKAWWRNLLSDLKYDRELRKCYRKANKRIAEAQRLCKTTGKQYFVLPDNKGDFFCFNNRELRILVKNQVLPSTIDWYYCMKNAIYIANYNGKNVKRNFKALKEWFGK